MPQMIILTEARLECLVALANHFSSDQELVSQIDDDTTLVRWVRYQPDTRENILKVLSSFVQNGGIKDANLFVAIPFVKSDQMEAVAANLVDLKNKGIACTWFGAEVRRGKSGGLLLEDVCSQAGAASGAAFYSMKEYGSDQVNESPRTPWDDLGHNQKGLELKRNAYVEYRLQLFYMGVGTAEMHLRGTISQLVKPPVGNGKAAFPWTLPVLCGETGDVVPAPETEKMVRRFVEKRYPTIAGRSDRVERLKRLIRDVALTDLNVLIVGETGTGKEGAAYFIHELSRRRQLTYLELNCAGLDDEYLESTLFGHVKGSYTGATADRKGLVEEAAGGTIFLDELPELSRRVQAKLLRFIQSGEYRPMGSDKIKSSSCRIIAGGQPDRIERKIRLDLVMRLSEVEIRLPSLAELRATPGDIITIARNRADTLRGEHRVETHKDGSVSSRGVTREDVKTFWKILEESKGLLLDCDWPGNTRELFKTIKRSMLLGHSWRELLEEKIEKQRLSMPSGVQDKSLPAPEITTAGCVSFAPVTPSTGLLSIEEMTAAYVRHVHGFLGKKTTKEKLGISHYETLNYYLKDKEQRERARQERKAKAAKTKKADTVSSEQESTASRPTAPKKTPSR